MPIVAEEYVSLFDADTRGFDSGVAGMQAKLRTFADSMGKASDSVGSALGNVGARLRSVGDQVGVFGQVVSGAIGAAFGKSIIAASDLNESINKMSVVFGSAGQSVIEFANNSATSLGLSKAAALEAAGGFGNILVSMGLAKDKSAEMSTQMLQLAADMGSLNNVDPSVMLEKLRAGLVGEAEPLRTVGVLLSENAVKLKASELGYKAVGGQLTEQQKVMARYAIILEQSKTAQGDFARTSQDVANASRIVKAQFENLVASIGQQFLPTVKSALGFVSNLVKGFDGLSPSVKSAIGSIVAVTGVAAALVPVISGLSFAFGALLSPIGAVVAGIALLVVAYRQNLGGFADSVNRFVSAVNTAWASHGSFIMETTRATWGYVSDVMRSNFAYISKLVDTITAAIEGRWSAMLSNLSQMTIQALTLNAGRIASFSADLANSLGKKITGFDAGAEVKRLMEGPDMGGASGFAQKWYKAWNGVGQQSAQGLADGFAEKYGPPDNPAFVPPKAPAGIKNKGVAMGKALVDGFTDGLSGLKEAIAKVDSSDLSALFQRMGANAKAGAGELKSALKVVTDAINEFAASQGVGSKLNEAQLANMEVGTRKALERQTLAYKTAKDEIQRIQVEGLASNKTIFAATQAEIDKMTAGAKASFAALGGVFKVMPPLMTAFETVASESFGYTSNAIEDFADSAQIDFRKFQSALDKLAAEAPKPFSAISIAALKTRDDLQKALGDSEMLQVIKAQLDVRSSINGVISTLEDYGTQMGKSGAALDAWVEDTIRKMPQFAGANKEALEAAIEAHKRAAIQLPGIWESIFGKLNSSAKKQVSGFLDIIGALPGGFKKVADQIQDWVGRIDTIFKGLHKIFDAIPDGLSGVFQKITGLFKATQTGIQGISTDIFNSTGLIIKNVSASIADATGTISESMAHSIGGAAAQVGGEATKAGADIGKNVTSGMSDFLDSGIGLAAALTGAFSLAISTFQSDSKTKRFLGGFALGGPIGGLLSVIFGGPSELQKAQMAAQLQQAKDAIKLSMQSVEQAYEQTKQSILETVGKVRDILESIRFYDSIGKPALRAFFGDLNKFMTRLAEEAGNWNKLAQIDIEAAATQLGAGVDLIAKLPAALSAISTHIKVGEAQLNIFFADANAFFAKLGEFVGNIPKEIQKAIGKFGNRTEAGVNILGPLIEAIKAMTDIPDVPEVSFTRIEAILTRIIEGMSRVSGSVAKSLQKAVAFMAEQIGPGVELWKSTIDAIRAAIDVPMLTDQDAENVVSGMRLFVDKLVAGFANFNTEGLGTVIAIANAILPVAAAIEAWAKATESVKGYSKIATETWQNIADDFARAKDLISMMLASAIEFVPKSVQFKDVMAEIAANLRAGLDSLGSGLAAAASAFGGVVNAIQGGAAPGTVVPGSGGGLSAQSLAPSFAGGMSAPRSSGGASSQSFVFHFHGDVSAESGFQDRVITAIVQAQRRGRL